MEVGNKLEYYKTEFYQLFHTNKDQTMIYAIGLVTVLGLVLTPIAWKNVEKDYKRTYVLFLIFGIILTIMTLTFFPFEKLPIYNVLLRLCSRNKLWNYNKEF